MAVAGADPTIRRRVIASAGRLVRRDSAASVGAIASDAGVSRATFYRHFGSRQALLRELNLGDAPASRDRVLEAAAGMLQRRSLSDLSMDELAAAAGISRATLYRLFSGKAELLRALIDRYAPFDAALAVLAANRHEPPGIVLPELGRTIMRTALPRLGIVRAVLIETTSGAARNLPGIRPVLQNALGELTAYLEAQMEVGTLRRMHPLLALQALLGPIAFHLLTRPVAGQVVGLRIDPDEAAEQLVSAALEGLRA